MDERKHVYEFALGVDDPSLDTHREVAGCNEIGLEDGYEVYWGVHKRVRSAVRKNEGGPCVLVFVVVGFFSSVSMTTLESEVDRPSTHLSHYHSSQILSVPFQLFLFLMHHHRHNLPSDPQTRHIVGGASNEGFQVVSLAMVLRL
jgi:hypothetical protein